MFEIERVKLFVYDINSFKTIHQRQLKDEDFWGIPSDSEDEGEVYYNPNPDMEFATLGKPY